MNQLSIFPRATYEIASRELRPERNRLVSIARSFGFFLLVFSAFVAFVLLVTFIAITFPPQSVVSDLKPGNMWGSLSDWYGGVIGISIGFAGTCIAIWLAYRVETLTAQQNDIMKRQSSHEELRMYKELAIESGFLKNRMQDARAVKSQVERIYGSLMKIREEDVSYTSEEDRVSEMETMGYATYDDIPDDFIGDPDLEEEFAASKERKEIESARLTELTKHQDAIIGEVAPLITLVAGYLSSLDAPLSAKVREAFFGDLPSFVKKQAECVIDSYNNNGFGNSDLEFELDALHVTQAQSDLAELEAALSFLLRYTRPESIEPVVYHRSLGDGDPLTGDLWQDMLRMNVTFIPPHFAPKKLNHVDFFTEIWAYLPRASFFVAENERVKVDWISPLINCALYLSNPLKVFESEIVRIRNTASSGADTAWFQNRLTEIVSAPLREMKEDDPMYIKVLRKASSDDLPFDMDGSFYQAHKVVYGDHETLKETVITSSC